MRRRAMGALAFGMAAAGSAAVGYAAKRRAVAGVDPVAGSEWDELRRPIHGDAEPVTSFDGTVLHAEVLGPADAPTLVFVHGYGLSQHAWHYQRRDLADRFRLVCYDQRGHGASQLAASGDYSMDALGRDFAAVVAATVPAGRPLVAVGHSMGGMSLLAYADRFPDELDRLAGVALLATAGGNVVAGSAFTAGTAALSLLRGRARRGRRPDRRPASVADLAAEADEPVADTLFLLTRALGLSPHAHPAHVAFTEQLLVQAPGRVKAALGPTLSSLRLAHAAERLTMPGVVLVGDADRLTPVRQARRLADAMPRSRLAVVAEAGHMLPLEAHERVSAELGQLAEEIAGGGR